MSKRKITQLMQTHGRLEDVEHKTLDQIWGDTGTSKYSTLDQKEYIHFISEMNKSDLQAHANKIGLVPIDNRDLLTKRLLAEFKKFTSTFKTPKSTSNSIKLDKQIKNILSEGK